MSASFSTHVPFFRCESFPYISRRADWFPCALFPFHSPCIPLVFIAVPCMSLSVPLCFPFMSRCFPVMSTSYFLPSFPCTSLHFPFAPQYFPQNNAGFPAFSQLGRPKTQTFSIFSAKGGRNSKPAKSRQGESSLGPLFCDTGRSPRSQRYFISSAGDQKKFVSVLCLFLTNVDRLQPLGSRPFCTIAILMIA